jgi:hypothetical protein
MASVVAPTPSPRRGDKSRRWRVAPKPSPRRLLADVASAVASSSRDELLLRTMFVYYCCISSRPAIFTASSRDTQTGVEVASSGARFK